MPILANPRQAHTRRNDVDSINVDVPLRRILEPVEAAQERAFTRSAGADQNHDLTPPDNEVNATQHVEGSIAFVKALDPQENVIHHLIPELGTC
jgi:hypothetical protein